LLKDGNERFVRGERVTRDLMRQVDATSQAQFPMAVVLGCMDSRTSTELIFDLGLGDIFSVRVGGNVASESALASLEYACAVAGAKLIIVLGHTRCGAVGAAIDLYHQAGDPCSTTGCAHIQALTDHLDQAIALELAGKPAHPYSREVFVDRVARQNVRNTMDSVHRRSSTLRALIERGQIAVVGGLYDVRSGKVQFMEDLPEDGPAPDQSSTAPSRQPLDHLTSANH
jgi:carbonic anhydrase/SulP family sulfate permease